MQIRLSILYFLVSAGMHSSVKIAEKKVMKDKACPASTCTSQSMCVAVMNFCSALSPPKPEMFFCFYFSDFKPSALLSHMSIYHVGISKTVS